MPLPTFLVIGAQKCGTTSLHSYLGAHPEIEMPADDKELDFFLAGSGHDADWYAAQWSGGTPARGEVSPNYTAYPFHDGVPARAAALVPEARLLFLVRDPIARIVSHYVHRRAVGLERRPFASVVEESEATNGYLHRSRYMWQLEQWLAHYPAERVCVVVSERLRHARTETLDRIFAFLGVATGLALPAVDEERYTAADRRELTAGGLALERAPAARLARGLLPRAVREPVVRRLRAGLSRSVPAPEPTDAERAALRDALRDDVARLRAFAGDPLPEWSL